MAVFAYLRVSTTEQTTDNQRLEITNAGIAVDYWFSESVSGSVHASQRKEFNRLLSQIREGETLVVTKLDRLGRDALDVQQTVQSLKERNISVRVIQLGGLDLTSPIGKMALAMLSAVAELEREVLIERVLAGQARAKAQGVKFGRKPKTTTAQQSEIKALVAAGEVSISEIARRYNVSRATVLSIGR